MNGLIDTLLSAPAETRMFRRGESWISAGDIRAMAARVVLPPGDGAVFVHTTYASHLCAGVLAAAAEHRTIVLPAHTQASYLAEIGAETVIGDAAFASGGANRKLDAAARDAHMLFFTSGSTGTPKPVDKQLAALEGEVRTHEARWGDQCAHTVATVSHQHIYGLTFRIVWPLMAGRTTEDETALYWEDLRGKLAGATLISSPAHLTRLPPHSDLFTPPPGFVLSSGQLLPFVAARACIAAFGFPVIEILGSTETNGIGWRKQTAEDTPWTPFSHVRLSSAADGVLVMHSPFVPDGGPQTTGDIVELLQNGAFRLKPRGDRVVKIDGKRVSLTRVEEALKALPECSAAAALTLPERSDGLAAIVELTEAGWARHAELSAFRFSRYLRGALSEPLEPAERPKHWRFVEQIPTDPQGKRVLSALRALFDAPSPLDVLKPQTNTLKSDEAELSFTLPAELIFFEGHFPNVPILPGLAQVHMAVLIAQKLWAQAPSDFNILRLKFRRTLLPGDHVVLKLKRDARIGRLAFAYHYGDVVASEGEIGGTAR